MAGALCPVLVGRGPEVSRLRAVLADAAAGRGALVVLAGEAGVGKSRLAREAETMARERDMATMVGRAVATRTPIAFRPISEALLGGRRAAELVGPERSRPLEEALALLLPETGPTPRPNPSESVLAAGDAVLRALSLSGRSKGCLLVLDDLHWSDPETLAVVEYLADNLADQPVACVGTLRSEGPSEALDVVGRLASRRAAQVVELGRLGEGDVGAMARACLGSTEIPSEIEPFLVERADGLPLLVEDLLAALIEGGLLRRHEDSWTVVSPLPAQVPRTFADSVHQRLLGADDTTRQVLHAASVLGRRFDWSLLAAVTGLEEAVVVQSLRRAVEVQLLAVDREAGGFLFRHALGRDAVLADLLPPEVARLAAAAVAALEKAHPGLEGPSCELAAELAQRAGQRAKAASLLLEAGRRALRQGALATAEGVLERALRLAEADDAELWLEIACHLTQALTQAGRVERTFAVGGAVLGRLSVLPGSAARVAELHLDLARAALAAGLWGLAADHLDRGRAAAGSLPEVSEVLQSRLDALGAHIALEERRFSEAVALARAALSSAERCDAPEVACEALEVLGRESRSVNRLADAEAAFARANAVAEAHGLVLFRLRALHELGTIELMRSVGVERLHEARALAADAGAVALAATLDLQIASGLALQFRGEDALVVAQRSVDASRRFRLRTLPKALVVMAFAHSVCGDRQQMELAAGEAMKLAPSDVDVAASVWGFCRATLSLLAEEREQARREMETGWEILARAGAGASLPFPALWALLAVVDDAAGDRVCADVRAAGCVGSGMADGFLACAEAVLLGRAGRRKEAAAAFAAGDQPAPRRRSCVPPWSGRVDGAPALHALAVTSREMDVLALIARGSPMGGSASASTSPPDRREPLGVCWPRRGPKTDRRWPRSWAGMTSRSRSPRADSTEPRRSVALRSQRGASPVASYARTSRPVRPLLAAQATSLRDAVRRHDRMFLPATRLGWERTAPIPSSNSDMSSTHPPR